MGFACVPAFPVDPTNPLVSGVLHPLPIDLREMRKLCEVEKSCVGADFEGICETRREAVLGRRPTDPQPSTGTPCLVTTSAGLEEKSPISLKKLNLSYPRFELLRPSVVISRRPKRMQGFDVS